MIRSRKGGKPLPGNGVPRANNSLISPHHEPKENYQILDWVPTPI